MLITQLENRGSKEETEHIILTARNIPIKPNEDYDASVAERQVKAPPFLKLEEGTLYESEILRDVRELGPFALTGLMKESKALDLLRDMQSIEKFKNIRFQTIYTGNNYTQIYAEAKACKLKELPKQFKIGAHLKEWSTLDILRKELHFPFPIVEHHNNKLSFRRQLSLDEFLSLPTISLDSEFMHWEESKKIDYLRTARQDIEKFLASAGILEDLKPLDNNALISRLTKHFNDNKQIISDITRERKKIGQEALDKMIYEQPMSVQIGEIVDGMDVVHYFQHIIGKDETILTELATGKTKINFRKARNSYEMIQQVNEHLSTQKDPPAIILSHNGMTYDLKKLKQHGLEFFGERPKTKSKAGFFHQTIIPGTYQIDSAPYSQNYFPFTIDNKYATVMTLITGKRFEKKQGYDDLTRLTLEIILGSEDASRELAEYGCEDITGMNHAAEYLKTMVYLKGILFMANPEQVCATSKRTLALNTYKYSRFRAEKSYPTLTSKENKQYTRFNAHDAFIRLAGYENKKELPSKYSKHFGSGILVYLAPFTSIYNNMLVKNSAIKAMYSTLISKKDAQRQTSHWLERFDIINTIEQGFLLPYIFYAYKRGFEGVDASGIVKKYRELLERFPPLNRSDNFYVFQEEAALDNRFTQGLKGIGFIVAQGKLYNVKRGAFVMYNGLNLFKRELDSKGNLGYKTIYQEEIVHDIVQLIFKQEPDAAAGIVIKYLEDIRDENLDRNKMIYFRKSMIKDYFDYSSYAQKQERIKAAIEFGLHKGDKLEYFKSAERKIPILKFIEMSDKEVFSKENIESIVRSDIGPRTKNKIRFEKGTIGKYIEPILQDDSKKSHAAYIRIRQLYQELTTPSRNEALSDTDKDQLLLF